jgi:hypothetical protein
MLWRLYHRFQSLFSDRNTALGPYAKQHVHRATSMTNGCLNVDANETAE